MDSYNMQGHKLYWHLDRVNEWIQGNSIVPLYIDMGITQTCNLKCQYCYYATPKHRNSKKIPTTILKQFLNDAARIGVKAVGFLGDGEPMLHPGVYESVITGKEAGLDMAISTNGLLMKKDNLDNFLKSLTWIRFNISAAEPHKYEEIMGVPKNNFQKVINNIKKCVDVKRDNQLDVTIGMQMVLISNSVDQIIPFAKLGKELGVDYAVIKQCSERIGVKQDLSIDDYKQYEEVMLEAESCSSQDYNVIIKRKKIEYKKRNYNNCYGCEFLPQISGAGEVYCCGNFFRNKKYLAGNLLNESFPDIIFGEKYKKVMNKVRGQVNVHKSCGEKCRQNEINEFLWMLKNPPNHLNFI